MNSNSSIATSGRRRPRFRAGKLTLLPEARRRLVEAAGHEAFAMNTVLAVIRRHSRGRWGNVSEVDAQLNDYVLAASTRGPVEGHVLISHHRAFGINLEIATTLGAGTVVRMRSAAECRRSLSHTEPAGRQHYAV